MCWGADTAQDHRDGSEGWQEQEGCASEGRAEPQAGARRILLGVKVCLSFGVRGQCCHCCTHPVRNQWVWRTPCKRQRCPTWANSRNAHFGEPMGGGCAPLPLGRGAVSEHLLQEENENRWGNVNQQLLENVMLEKFQLSPLKLIPKYILKVAQGTLILSAA